MKKKLLVHWDGVGYVALMNNFHISMIYHKNVCLLLPFDVLHGMTEGFFHYSHPGISADGGCILTCASTIKKRNTVTCALSIAESYLDVTHATADSISLIKASNMARFNFKLSWKNAVFWV